MSYLTLDADRLVRDAVDAFLDGRLRSDTGGDCVYATRNSQYRVVDGFVHEASDTALMGAELVGWLVEELGQPMVEPLWRPYARAIFAERKTRHVVVTSRTLTRTAISGPVPAVPLAKRRPSVIPPSPPIPTLKGSAPPPSSTAESVPTFRLPEALRDAARSIGSDKPTAPPPPPGESPFERPTERPPPEEATALADRASYEDLLVASRAAQGPLPSFEPPDDDDDDNDNTPQSTRSPDDGAKRPLPAPRPNAGPILPRPQVVPVVPRPSPRIVSKPEPLTLDEDELEEKTNPSGR
ncbi:MAG: hypothetical protein U0271_28435 [Polyangiaceae bacterium]